MTQRKSIGIGAVRIADRILEVRGRRVILDSELATLYGSLRQLNQAVRRNPGPFLLTSFSTIESGGCSFEITICDLKGGTRWAPLLPACVHRARRNNGGDHPEYAARNRRVGLRGKRVH
jgi:hypothetical protein